MRAITPLGRGLLVVSLLALVGLIVGSGVVQVAGAIALALAVAAGGYGCWNSGQGLQRLYDPERLARSSSDAGAIADAVSRGQADGGTNAAAYAGAHLLPPGGG